MNARMTRRRQRVDDRKCISFLDAASRIPRTSITVRDARAGDFEGSVIPADLERQ